MPVQHTEWTADLVRALPEDGNRYEVLDGELFVTPAPSFRHQDVLARLFAVIDPYVRKHQLGWTLWSPADIEFSPKRYVQPDLFVVPDSGTGKPREWGDIKSLLLVIEALSPTTARADRIRKRPIYQEHAVPEYWIADRDARLVERWRPVDERPEVIERTLTWQPKVGIDPLVIDLDEIFGPTGP